MIALLFLLEMAPASEGGRYMRMYPEKAIEALIVIPAERKSTLTGTVEYDSQPPEMRNGKYRWNQALNASTTDGTKSLPPVVHR